jgi:hypothetical protein
MGLFDGYYDSGTYQGGGSLIDRLVQQLTPQSQYQPSAGFAPSPMDANASAPAPAAVPQASPIGVGDYQMPRVGAASGFTLPPPHDPMTGQTIAPATAAPVAQPAFLQPQHSPGGFGGVMRGAMANAQGGILGMLGGAVAGGMGMGQGTEQDQRTRSLKAQYDALVPILGEQKAQLAVINPEIGKTMVAQALAGKQYAFTTLPDGTVLRQDPHAGTVAPVYSSGSKPTFGVVGEEDGKKVYGFIDPGKRAVTPYQTPGSGDEERGTVTGPDGKHIAIPAGVDRKTFVNDVSKASADAATGKKTEVQAKAEIFANKMESAESILKDVQNEGASALNRAADGSDWVPGSATAGRYIQSDKYQKYKQASSNFITALLRQESGAAISKDEFTRYEKEYMPMPGDGKAVIRQKAEARRVAIEGMKKGAGPGYKSPTVGSDGAVADPLGIR